MDENKNYDTRFKNVREDGDKDDGAVRFRETHIEFEEYLDESSRRIGVDTYLTFEELREMVREMAREMAS